MKQFTRTVTIASALAVFAAGQLFYSQANTGSKQLILHSQSAPLAELIGMDCVSKKLILPEKPKEPEEPVEFLQNVLARYGE